MKEALKVAFSVLVLAVLVSTTTKAATYTARSCNTADVQSAINSAAEGDTVTIPAGTCTWTSGVTISGKGITLAGAGSGRVIAYTSDTHTVATGTLTINVSGYSPGFSGSSFTNGERLLVYETNSRGNYMQGTVTSFSNGVLTMNVSNIGGAGTTHRWLVTTLPSSTIIDNSTSAPLFAITEDTSVHTNISGIQFVQGSGTSAFITLGYRSGGVPILMHDLWLQLTGAGDYIDSTTNRGVIWSSSFDGSSNNPGQLVIGSPVRIKGAPASSWTTPSTMGTSDTTGTNNFYVETNDFHALQSAIDNDDNGRVVWRYNLMDNSQFSTHGADTSNYGQRHFEFYNNTGVFNAYSDGTTFNLNGWLFLVRGGTFVIYSNNLPRLQSGDYGTKPDVNLTVMNLQRNGGPNPCWGAGTSNGALYHAPRQVGMGYVTGTGRDGEGRSNDSITYVGDSEPGYIWGNSQTPLNVGVSDYGGSDCSNPDNSSNYIVLNRDYFNGSTPKPGWTPYPYPHPLTQGGGGDPPAPPTGLQAVPQ